MSIYTTIKLSSQPGILVQTNTAGAGQRINYYSRFLDTDGSINITNADGVSGNPLFGISGSWTISSANIDATGSNPGDVLTSDGSVSSWQPSSSGVSLPVIMSVGSLKI